MSIRHPRGLVDGRVEVLAVLRVLVHPGGLKIDVEPAVG
jgi:hypothetical protein